MLRIAGGPERLRPHIKTHKLPELVRRQVELGITKFNLETHLEFSFILQHACYQSITSPRRKNHLVRSAIM